MPVTGSTLIVLTAASIAFLLVLILGVKLHAFLGLILTAMALGLATGMPPDKVLKSIQAGFGDALGFIAVVVGLGAMIGRFLEHSDGGRALADWLLVKFGRDRGGGDGTISRASRRGPRAGRRAAREVRTRRGRVGRRARFVPGRPADLLRG